MPYVSLMVTTKQKASIEDKGETEHTITENHQFTKVSEDKGKRKQWKYKTIRWH